jgi:hypothetical protein
MQILVRQSQVNSILNHTSNLTYKQFLLQVAKDGQMKRWTQKHPQTNKRNSSQKTFRILGNHIYEQTNCW